MVPTKRSATAFALGERIGVRMTRTPSVRNTSSKGPEYLAPRSWITNWTGANRSSMAKWQACWVTQEESGWALTPARCTLRVKSSMKKRT